MHDGFRIITVTKKPGAWHVLVCLLRSCRPLSSWLSRRRECARLVDRERGSDPGPGEAIEPRSRLMRYIHEIDFDAYAVQDLDTRDGGLAGLTRRRFLV